MKRITKANTPEFWEEFLKRNPHIHYDDLENSQEGKNFRRKMTEFLLEEQKYLCAYCCSKIDKENAHNEHIRPQSCFPKDCMDYYNLLASCMTKETCGRQKKGKYDNSKFVSPLDDDCEKHFGFTQDAQIVPKTKKGRYTIELLNLNAYSLTEKRKATFMEVSKAAEDLGKQYVYEYYILPHEGKLPRFVDMIEFFYSQGFFDKE